MNISNPLKLGTVLMFLFFSLNNFGQSGRKFVIILDAGHGGKDPGNSYNGFVEKNIALKTTLKVEKYLEKDHDIQVVFTRKTDVFVKLVDRPDIANKIHANLFVSIHCNSVKSGSPFGTETFIMGLARSNTNFEIAKNENSVILLEKDYKKTYKGFDPNAPETLIGLKILQEEYLNRSISLASKVEDNFTNKINRKTRGIKQTPLWVLDAAYMPSVLIELGFLSNKEEGTYLNSEFGQEQMAENIAAAIISYKNEYFESEYDESASPKKIDNQARDSVTLIKYKTVDKDILVPKAEATKASPEVIYKVQIASSSKKLSLEPKNFKGLNFISVSYDAKIYKYMYGETPDLAVVKKQLQEAKSKGYESAFLIAFRNGEKISIQDALK